MCVAVMLSLHSPLDEKHSVILHYTFTALYDTIHLYIISNGLTDIKFMIFNLDFLSKWYEIDSVSMLLLSFILCDSLRRRHRRYLNNNKYEFASVLMTMSF